MKVEVKLDPSYIETVIKIYTNKITEETSNLIKKLERNDNKLVVWQKEKLYFIDFNEIETIYSSQGKVYVRANNNEYISKSKLYELEEQIKLHSFIRISNSEIINFDKVENLDMSITGTIEIKFKSSYITYASRRNIKKTKTNKNRKICHVSGDGSD